MNDLEVFAEIEKMGNNAGVYRPHKALLLLAVADLFEQSKLNTSCVFYNEELKNNTCAIRYFPLMPIITGLI